MLANIRDGKEDVMYHTLSPTHQFGSGELRPYTTFLIDTHHIAREEVFHDGVDCYVEEGG